MSKSVSWDQSFAAALRERAEQSRAEAIRVAATTAAAAATTAAATARSGHQGDGRKAAAANTRHPGAADSVPEQHIPRSVSCSSLEVRRTLFPRSSSRDELGMTRKAGFGGRRGSDGRRGVLHRRGVSFDTQVRYTSFLLAIKTTSCYTKCMSCCSLQRSSFLRAYQCV